MAIISRPYNGHAYGTVLRPSVCLSVVVCDIIVLWLNGVS